MTKWIREHKETIEILLLSTLAPAAAVLIGVLIGGVLSFGIGFGLVVSGVLDGMIITSWGY